MQNGSKTGMNGRHPRRAASFAARPKQLTSRFARSEPKGSQNAQRNYERYLALARAEALAGNSRGRVLLPARRTLLQIDFLGPRCEIGGLAATQVNLVRSSSTSGPVFSFRPTVGTLHRSSEDDRLRRSCCSMKRGTVAPTGGLSAPQPMRSRCSRPMKSGTRRE
jgi:hypothetical protein